MPNSIVSFCVESVSDVMVTRRVTSPPSIMTLAVMRYVTPGASDGVL